MKRSAKNISLHNHSSAGLSSVAGVIILSSAICIILAEVYAWVALTFEAVEYWLSAALINSIISITALVWFVVYRRRDFSMNKILAAFDARGLWWQSRAWVFPYMPSMVLLVSVVAASSVSHFIGDVALLDVSFRQILWVIWIPVVEEVVFRWGVGTLLKQRVGLILGAYFSILVFSVSHTVPTVSRIVVGEIGLPVGPMLLAIFCELVYVGSGKLAPAIALHASCNASIIIFSLVDARWLDWLGPLYG